MAKVTCTVTEPNTPAPKKGGSSKNAFPTFTPATTRMTRAQAKAAGIDAPIALDLQVSTRKPKKTKIPPGVGLEQIPSPGNLKSVRKTRGAAKKKEKLEVEDVIDDLGALELGGRKEKKVAASKAAGSKKGKAATVEEEDEEVKEKEEKKSGRLTRSNTVVKHDVKAKGKGKGKATTAISDSDEDMESFDVTPVIPPALQSRSTRTTRSASTSKSTTTPDTDVDNEILLQSLAPFLSQKKLWEMDDSDITDLRKAAGNAEKDSEAETVLKGMLDVMEKFQAFRDGLDEYMEDMEELGLGLIWEDDDEEV